MSNTPPTPSKTSKKKSSAIGACNFCRKMHSSCEGRPRCSNCTLRGIECVFTEKRKPGPPIGFKKRRQALAAANAALANIAKELEGKSNIRSSTETEEMITDVEQLEIFLPTIDQNSPSAPPTTEILTELTPLAAPTSQISPSNTSSSPYLSPNSNESPSQYPLFDPYGSPSINRSATDGLPDSPGFSSIPSMPSSPSISSPHHTSPGSHYNSSTPGSSNSPLALFNHSYSFCSDSSALTLTIPSSPTNGSSFELTIPNNSKRRVNPDRVFTAAAPYVNYLEVFQRLFQDDVLGIFPFIEVPSLDNLFPLVGMTRQGKVSQILLLTVLSMGALNIGEQKQFQHLGELAFKSADEYIQEHRGRKKDTLTKTELQQECITFLLLSVIDRASGSFSRAPQISRYMFETCNEYFSDSANRCLDHTTGWMIAHINAKSKILFPRDYRLRRSQQFLLNLPTADPSVRLFTILTSVLDQMMEMCCMCTELSTSDFGWMQSLVDQAEDSLSYLENLPQYGTSGFRKLYAAIFSAMRAVMLYLTGRHNSAVSLATAAAYQLMDCIDSRHPGFFAMPIALSLVTKIHCFNNDHQMLQVCLGALKQYEQRFPAIKIFWSGLEIPTSDTAADGWFPDFKKIVLRSREVVQSMKKNVPPRLQPEPYSAKGILSHMDSILECDWL